MEEEEDVRRESAMAATPLLQPNFRSSSVSHSQLQKLKELRRRRLQIKRNASSFKNKGKKNGDKSPMVGKGDAKQEIIQTDHQENIVPEESYLFAKKEDAVKTSKEQNALCPWKKRQKLHWGLDTKERWERKGNM